MRDGSRLSPNAPSDLHPLREALPLDLFLMGEKAGVTKSKPHEAFAFIRAHNQSASLAKVVSSSARLIRSKASSLPIP